MDERRLVYSTDGTLPLPEPARAKVQPRQGHARLPDDGVIRVAKERRRAGVVTVVHGVPASELTETGKALKRTCGTGGTAKDGVVELQGDHRNRVVAYFETQGRRVKRVGS
jgi:translation initiation factor 1